MLFPNTAKLTANLQRAHWAESCLGRLSPQLGGSKEKWVALNTAPGPAAEQQEAISALAPCQHRGRAGRGLAMSSLYPRYIPANEADTIVLAVKCNSCSHPKLNLKFEVSSPPLRPAGAEMRPISYSLSYNVDNCCVAAHISFDHWYCVVSPCVLGRRHLVSHLFGYPLQNSNNISTLYLLVYFTFLALPFLSHRICTMFVSCL